MTPNPYQAWLERKATLDILADVLTRYCGFALACVVLAEGIVHFLPWITVGQPWFVRAPVAVAVIAGWLLYPLIGWIDNRKYRRQVAIEKAQLRSQRQEEKR